MGPAVTETEAAAAEAPRPAAPAPRAVTSAELFLGARRLTIAHGGELYTLQITRQNKLLLTK